MKCDLGWEGDGEQGGCAVEDVRRQGARLSRFQGAQLATISRFSVEYIIEGPKGRNSACLCTGMPVAILILHAIRRPCIRRKWAEESKTRDKRAMVVRGEDGEAKGILKISHVTPHVTTGLYS